MRYRDRIHAGGELAKALAPLGDEKNLIVLALPRGGVPVAAQVANALHAPLDVFVVRKLGAPGNEEFALGAIASGGEIFLNDSVTRFFSPEVIDEIVAREKKEVQRREILYRGSREPPALAARTVILIDDGIATGATMKAALAAIRKQKPERIVVAVPVAPASSVYAFEKIADKFVCPHTPVHFDAVCEFYENFSQTNDEEVHKLLILKEKS